MGSTSSKSQQFELLLTARQFYEKCIADENRCTCGYGYEKFLCFHIKPKKECLRCKYEKSLTQVNLQLANFF